MPKKPAKQQAPRRLEALPQQGARRLSGDDLFAWATMQEQARQLSQQINGFIQMQSQALGFDPNIETIDPVGYIRPIQRQPMPVQVAENSPQTPQEGAEPES